jgi:predicted nuclease of restriction endonuclease-like (RecB) superfamily
MTPKRITKKTGISKRDTLAIATLTEYSRLVIEISELLAQARHSAARSVNALLTATYWEIGRRIVEFEQGGKSRAGYGEEVLLRLSQDLVAKHGRGFSERNLRHMRVFFLGWEIWQTPSAKLEARVKCQTVSGKSGKDISQIPSEKSDARAKCPTVSGESEREIWQTASAKSDLLPLPISTINQPGSLLTDVFPLAWSQYVRLMAVENPQARAFYESEAIRGGWSVRQLDRQISTQFYERAVRAKRPAALIARGRQSQLQDAISVEEEIRDPYLLEFLNLKDEYSESQLEEALIRHLEWFLLEMGAGFAFIARQKRIRIGDSWYRIDLLLYHRGLRCLVIIDLKTGAFSHTDAGQMNLYLNYAKEHLMLPGEADPVGIILCSDKDDAVVKYATGGILTRVFASKYLTNLPDEETLRREILTTQRALRARWEEKKSNG